MFEDLSRLVLADRIIKVEKELSYWRSQSKMKTTQDIVKTTQDIVERKKLN